MLYYIRRRAPFHARRKMCCSLMSLICDFDDDDIDDICVTHFSGVMPLHFRAADAKRRRVQRACAERCVMRAAVTPRDFMSA